MVTHFGKFVHDPIVVAAFVTFDPVPRLPAQLIQPAQSCALLLNKNLLQFFFLKGHYMSPNQVELPLVQVSFHSHSARNKLISKLLLT